MENADSDPSCKDYSKGVNSLQVIYTYKAIPKGLFRLLELEKLNLKFIGKVLLYGRISGYICRRNDRIEKLPFCNC